MHIIDFEQMRLHYLENPSYRFSLTVEFPDGELKENVNQLITEFNLNRKVEPKYYVVIGNNSELFTAVDPEIFRVLKLYFTSKNNVRKRKFQKKILDYIKYPEMWSSICCWMKDMCPTDIQAKVKAEFMSQFAPILEGILLSTPADTLIQKLLSSAFINQQSLSDTLTYVTLKLAQEYGYSEKEAPEITIGYHNNEVKLLPFLPNGDEYLRAMTLFWPVINDVWPTIEQPACVSWWSLFEGVHADIDIDLLASITEWAWKDVEENRKSGLPKGKWYIKIEDEQLKKYGLEKLTFIKEEPCTWLDEATGQEIEMRLVYVKVLMTNGKFVPFYLSPPGAWVMENERAMQSYLMAYATCAFRDLVVIKDSYLDDTENEIAATNESFLPEVGPPKVRESKNKLVKTYRHIRYFPKHIKRTGCSNNNDTSESTKRDRAAHWVSWHVRRLQAGWKPSEGALLKAQKYGFRVPPGFTFVDTHIRCLGEVQDIHNEFEVRVTAIDILSESLKNQKLL